MSAVRTRPRVELAEILRGHGDAYRARHPVSPEQAAVMRHLVACRTAALGGHVDSCSACGWIRVSYNSCRDRHCPKCQGHRQQEWIQARLEKLLPVPYFHIVFTLPQQLNPLALRNRRVVYNLLFQAASQTLLQLAADPQRLGAQIGFTAVLHTWGQNLLFHPHLHCVVTGGGLSLDGQTWVAARQKFFLPVKVLARLFRGKFLALLQRAHQRGELALAGSVANLAQPKAFRKLLDTLHRQNWVVFAKPPMADSQHVYRYLGRYTHRVAISNARLVAFNDGRVRFRFKDYADSSRIKEMTLAADEFLRRFLLHVLPKGLVRIRHYGLLAGHDPHQRFERARQILESSRANDPSAPHIPTHTSAPEPATCCPTCPHCHAPLSREYFLPLDTVLVVVPVTDLVPVCDTS